MNFNEQPWYFSWPVIIVAFIAFWPVGIALLVLRNINNKQSVFMASSAHMIYLGIGVLLIIAGFGSFSKSFIAGLFYLIGGIALISYSGKLKKKSARNKQYIELIVNRNEEGIDKIANICGISYEEAEKELQTLIDKNVLKNALIDRNARTITLSRPQLTNDQPYYGGAAQGTVAGSMQISCTCPGCGAKMVLNKGDVINCEYCDTPITAK